MLDAGMFDTTDVHDANIMLKGCQKDEICIKYLLGEGSYPVERLYVRLTKARMLLYCAFPITQTIEDVMAKKTAKKAAAKKTTKKKAPAKKAKPVAVELEPAEVKAFELAHSSEEVCDELENAVTESLTGTVRKVFKKHGVALSAEQAQKVALLLFGD